MNLTIDRYVLIPDRGYETFMGKINPSKTSWDRLVYVSEDVYHAVEQAAIERGVSKKAIADRCIMLGLTQLRYKENKIRKKEKVIK